MRKKILGQEHPSVAMSINNLAVLYFLEGRYSKAEPLYVKALAIAKKVLGESHPNTKQIRENYEYLKNQKDNP